VRSIPRAASQGSGNGLIGSHLSSRIRDGSITTGGISHSYGTATGTVQLQTYATGLFTFDGKYVAGIHGDGGGGVSYVAPTGYFGAAAVSRPALPNEQIVIYGTGFGPT
jgi:uncharacterized protein (TIGR03437 family)